MLAAAVLFGTTGTSQALGPEGATPLGVGAARVAVGGVALALVAAIAGARGRARGLLGSPRLTGRSALLMGVAGACLFSYQPLFFLGTSANGVAVGTVIALGSAPVLAGALEWALTRRCPGGLWLAATALATSGVAVLALGGQSDATTSPVGVAASVGAGASFAVFTVSQRRLLDDGWRPLTIMGAAGAVAALLAVALLLPQDVTWLAEPRGTAVALWLGLVTTALAYTAFTWGLQGVRAATAATLTLAEPLTASVLGLAVLGERLTLLAAAGILVLASGLTLTAWGARRPRNPRQEIA